jgi:LuxR family maltose regulon positive regulatory protein
LSVVPARISVLLISRQPPPQGFARLLANNAMGSVGWNDIRLTKEETAGIAQLHFKKISPEVTAQLHAATDGWAAGLVLLAAYARREPLAAADFVDRTPEEIFSYFASEVFTKAPPGIQDFLIGTSILPRITTRLAENLTRSKQADKILSNLSRNNYFTNKRVGSETTYQYHPLFREFLLEQAQATYTPRRLLQLKHTAAKLLEADNQVEDAFSLRRELADVLAMVRLIKGHAQTLLLQGRNQTLEQWFAALPPEVLAKDPWLLYWSAANCLFINPVESKALCEKALPLFERQRDRIGTLLALCGIFEAIAYGFGYYQPYDEWIPRLNALYKKIQPLPALDLEIKVTLSMLYALVFRQPTHPDLPFWEAQALALLNREPAIDNASVSQIMVVLLLRRANTGDLADARFLIDTYGSRAEAPGIAPIFASGYASLKAYYYSSSGEFEACRKAVAKGLELEADAGLYIFTPLLHGHGASAALSQGAMAQAETFMRGFASTLEQQGPYMKALFYLIMAWRHLLLKEEAPALLHAERSATIAEESGAPEAIELCQLADALALHACGRREEAGVRLAHCLALCRKTGARLMEFACLLAQAEFSLDQGDEGVTAVALRAALSFGRQRGYRTAWVWRPEVTARICGKALELGIEADYVRDLIKQRGLVPEKPPLHLESWPWPVKVYTLGSFALVKDGKQIFFSGKVQKKPLSLLKALIVLGGKEVKEEQLADLLWPEADGDHSHVVFKTTLSRLRRLLGHDKAIVVHEGRISLNPRYCWVDLWGLEGLLEEAEAAVKKIGEAQVGETGERVNATELFDKALSMYSGPFLMNEEDQAWIKAMRGRLQGRCSRLLIKLGGHREEQDQWEEATHYYERALNIDGVAEECYQRLMFCYHRLGQRAKVMEVYQRAREALGAVLGMKPSSQTEALYKTLI